MTDREQSLQNKILFQKELIELKTEGNKNLEKENEKLRKRNGELAGQKASLERWFGEAKQIIKDQKELLDRVLSGAETLSDFAQNTLRKAEQFLKENEE